MCIVKLKLLSLDIASSSQNGVCTGRGPRRPNDCSNVPGPSIPVGVPIANTAVFLVTRQQPDGEGAKLDTPQTVCCGESQVIAEHGAVGEVCIAGACVAAGYLG